MDHPRPGEHFPRSLDEFRAWFGKHEDCLDYLEWLRWPEGFACPTCGHRAAWRLGDARLMCSGCGVRTSVTSGTIFDRTRTPLTVWFGVCWHFASGKDGIAALSLKRTVEIGSYQTAWALLQRLRSVLVRPGLERLSGPVEVGEAYVGGAESGLSGGRAHGNKVLVGVAVEVRGPKGMGRCRIAPLVDVSGASLRQLVTDHVEQGATVITDGWRGCSGLTELGYAHERRNQRAVRFLGEDPDHLLPTVQQVIALAKRWLLGTYHGAVEPAHLPSYLNEFVFRFNHRHSRSPGMVFFRILELAVAHVPLRYHDLIATRGPRKVPPAAPHRRGHMPSQALPPAKRSWRAGGTISSG